MKKKILYFVCFVFFGFFSVSVYGEIKIVFRYDDYLLKPSKLNDSLIDIFQKNNIPLCLGVIPFDNSDSLIYKLNPDQINILISRIRRKEIEIALHGYNHVNNYNAPLMSKAMFSEFASVDYNKQYQLLAKGKRALDSLLENNTCVFVPPFNTYDKNTLKALEYLGFKIISGTIRGTTEGNLIKYMPPTYEDFSGLPDIINNFKDEDVVIILYFHPYSFVENSSASQNNSTNHITIRQLDSLLKWVKKQGVSFYTFSDLAKTYNFNSDLYQANSLKYNLLGKILNRLKLYRYGVYSTFESPKRNIGLLLGNVILHLLSFIFVYFLAYYIIKILHPSLKIVLLFLGICSIPILIFLLYIRNDFSFEIVLIMLIVNLTALILSLFRKYKQPIQNE
jgi:peptidoglycan/xylan/chitin deacetylase (PgdA/CDA1 family)